VVANEYFEIRSSPLSQNNGLYQATGTPTTSSVTATKISGSEPDNDTAETVTWLGESDDKNVFFDTAAKEIYLLEQGALDVAGVGLDIVYKFAKEEWKDDDYLNAFPFPFFAIDTDAGKYIIGTDGANTNGWNWKDVTSPAIRTRKLIRSAGWEEQDASGNVLAQHAGIQTLGVFAAGTDNAFYQFGTDTTVNDTVDFNFADAVNEAVECYTRLAAGSINGGTGIAISADGRTLTRSDGGNWRTDGFLAGGQIGLRDSEDSTMDGTWLIKSVQDATDGTLTCGRAADSTSGLVIAAQTITRADGGSWIDDGWVVGSKFITTASEDGGANDAINTITAITATVVTHAGSAMTVNADDTTMVCGMFDDALTPDITVNAAVDNRNAFAIRLREQGKTHDASDLAAAGESALGNRLFKFPLSNVTDLKIVTADASIIGQTPYVGTQEDTGTNGSVTAASATFTDATALAFIAGDVGKLICITSGTNVGMYEIVGFTSSSVVTVDRPFANTESSITWTLNPYGMEINYFATAQSIGGYAEGGGTFDFGIQLEANNGTAIQLYEYVQYQLRQASDIDKDASTGIGRALDDLLVFEGDTLISGKGIPRNPDGGGSGVYITNINSVDANNITNYDNLGAAKTFPETIAVTLDFNDAILNDTVATYDLYFDRTIRTTTDATFVVTAGTGDTGTFVSTAQQPTLNAGAGQYVRISGLTGADEPMNGVYQVTNETSTSSWDVRRWDGATIVTTTGAVANIDQYAIDTPDATIVQDNTPVNVQGTDPSADVTFSFDYDGNTQNGRTAETTFVVARAIGLNTAQFVQSSVQSIVSGQALTIVLTASNELNVE
jgi:hypothetical protein